MSGENDLFFDLIERLGAEGRPPQDPTVASCEAAAIAVTLYRQGSIDSTQVISTASEYLPRWADATMHGITAGIVGMLVTEPVPATLEVAALDISMAGLRARLDVHDQGDRSPLGYALQVTSKALAIQPFSMDTSIGQAVRDLAVEDENFANGITYDKGFSDPVFGMVTGLCLALAPEARA